MLWDGGLIPVFLYSYLELLKCKQSMTRKGHLQGCACILMHNKFSVIVGCNHKSQLCSLVLLWHLNFGPGKALCSW
jgi:hypothetical protein